MSTIYVFDNDLLGDDGTQFEAAFVESHDGTQYECLEWFEENYGANNYTASFTAPVGFI